MDRKEKLINYMSSSTYVPLKLDELEIVLDVPKDDRGELEELLSELINEGRIFKTKKGRYCAVSGKTLTASGKLMCSARGGFGFVRPDEEGAQDIFVAAENLGGAYDGDRVLVRIDKKDNSYGHSEGHVTAVIERGNETLVGIISGIKNKTYRLIPDRRSFFSQVRISPAKLGGAAVGDRVIVRIDEYNKKGKPVGEVITVLGRADSAESCLNGIISENGIRVRFPKPVTDEAEKVPESVSKSTIRGREDLRSMKIFTIDGDDSKDFDDAVSLEKLDNGNSLLGVHIADVSHYVKEGSELDKEALKRATSVYMPHKVIPMLPKKLSNGICSLNPGTDRLTFTVFMEIDGDGKIVSHRLVKSVIHSCERLTYNNVNKLLDGDTRLRERYSEIVPVLEAMDRLSDKLASLRSERGAIDFDFPETKVICGEDAQPREIAVADRGRSQRMIESFMLAANETVAEDAYWAELPFVYRVHEPPSADKLTAFNEFIKNFGYSLRGKLDPDTIHPKDLQRIAEQAKGTPEELMISTVMLRSLMKAGYRDTNSGHFGLAARYYCHFTSPIRRYPDLMIHRILSEYIDGGIDDSEHNRLVPIVREAAEQSSEREIAAEKAERDAEDLLKTVYMQAYLGESFDAVISSVTSFGIFAMMNNSCEGLIRCETMTADYFEFDESRRILTGKRTGKVYKIGDRIRVTVAGCSVLLRQIDLVLEEDANPSLLRRVSERAQKAERRSDEKKEKTGKAKRRGYQKRGRRGKRTGKKR